MSRTLTILHSGWASARALARGGRRTDALSLIERLLSRPDVPAVLATDARRLAGELELTAERYAAARRHLRAAAALEPAHAATHYRLGLAHERDPHGDDRRAAVRFKRASELEPGNALYRAAFGRAAVR
jgi:Flp pilus assembly protein TadD